MRAHALAAKAALVVLASLAGPARAETLEVVWSGSWSVDSGGALVVASVGPAAAPGAPPCLALARRLAIGGVERELQLAGAGSGASLALEGKVCAVRGLSGALQGQERDAKESRATLRATAREDGKDLVVDARYSVEGQEVRETWRRPIGVRIVALEASGRPVSGAIDLKLSGGFRATVQVTGSAVELVARVEVDPAHPHRAFYAELARGASAVLFEAKLGRVSGERTFTWDGRDATAAKRIALGGPYRLVVSAVSASQGSGQSGAGAGQAPDDGGLAPPPATATRSASPGLRDEWAFTVSPPRFEAVAPDFCENAFGTPQARWQPRGPQAVGERLRTNAARPWEPGFSFEKQRTPGCECDLGQAFEAAAGIVVSTHGAPGLIGVVSGDPAKPWDPKTHETRIFGADQLARLDLRDLHFAVVYSCNSGTREVTENRAAPSFLNLLVRRGCDVAIGFAAQAFVRDGEPFERLATDLMGLGVPIEESARLAARAVYREKFLDRKGRLPTEAEIDEALAAQRHAVAQELATSLRVVRADGIPADEPLSPPRYGNATN